MRTHVGKTTGGCFTALRQIRNVRQSLVVSRLDDDNATLTSIPGYLLRRLQSVLNAAAMVISGLPRSAHISSTLANLRAAELATLTSQLSFWRQLKTFLFHSSYSDFCC